MAQIWSLEDFSERARAPSAAEDFWDPALLATGRISRPVPAIMDVSIRLPLGLVTDPVEPEDNARGSWDYDDFDGAHQRIVDISDPWDNFLGPAAIPTANADSVSDFWEPTPILARTPLPPGIEDWSENISLPRYDPGASERPFSGFFQETKESLAEKRARWILSMLGITNPSRHRFVFDAFADLFIEYPHHSTFRAISDLALDDATSDELVNAFTLKQIWNDSPLFSSFRTKRRDVLVASSKASLLGWTLAIRLVRQSRGVPPEQIIDPDWFHDWLEVPYGDPLYWRFIDYICARIDSVESGALAIPPTTRRFILPLKEVGIDGFSPFHNFSRTSLLMRTYSDCMERSFVDHITGSSKE
jgi:hypothetical protein